MKFIHWTEIEAFHHVRKSVINYNHFLKGNSTVDYKSKIKLHGANSAVQVHHDGTLVCQSRNRIITTENDNNGFAAWVESNKIEILDVATAGYIYFGEWIGEGVQKNVACSKIPNKSFAIFAARSLDDDAFVVEPEELQKLVGNVKDIYVLPWHDLSISINYNKPPEELSSELEKINSVVSEIDNKDPWIERTFGITGCGEGLVFYPVSKEHLGYESFKNLCWKAKGEKHKNIGKSMPVQTDPSVAKGIDDFVSMVLTDARLEQGIVANNIEKFDMKQIGKFLKWIDSDIEKETGDELAASNLTFEQIRKPLMMRARNWYLTKYKSC